MSRNGKLSSCASLVYTCLAIASLVTDAQPATIVVDANGSGDYTSVAEGLLAANDDDEVWILAGTYDESEPNGDLRAVLMERSNISVRGTPADPSAVVVEGLYPAFVAEVEGKISGITWRRCGTVVMSGPHQDVSSCVFREVRDGSDALYLGSAEEALVSDCRFEDNNSSGSVLNANLNCTVLRSSFIGNSSSHGAVNCGSNATLSECLFWKNRTSTTSGSAVSSVDVVQIDRSTFWGQEGPFGHAAVRIDGDSGPPTSSITNSIIAGTRNGYGVLCGPYFPITCTNLWDNDLNNFGNCAPSPGSGVINLNPLFCDPDGGDFRLMATSPCLPNFHDGMDCDVMGAFGPGCGVSPTHETTWGRLKWLSGGRDSDGP